MNFLRPILIGAFAFFALNLNAQVQGNPASSNDIALFAQDNLELIITELSLSAEQVAKIEGLNTKVIQKIEVIQNDNEMNASRKKEFTAGNKEDHKRIMSTILTIDQFTAYETMMKAKASGQTEKATKSQGVKKTH